MKFCYDITIVIPVYERKDFFLEALKSAIDQTVGCKILVIDNCSSHSFFSDEVNRLNHPNITYRRFDQTVSMVDNWNRCIDYCETAFVSMLHDDDVLHSQFIEYSQIMLSLDFDILFTDSIVGEDVNLSLNKTYDLSQVRTRAVALNHFFWGNFNYPPGTVFNVKEAQRVGGFPKEYDVIPDMSLWMSLSKRSKAIWAKEVFSFYRVSASQNTNKIYVRAIQQTYKISEEIPLNKSKVFKTLSNYLAYRGGMQVYMRTSKNPILTEFGNCQEFLRDHAKWGRLYKFWLVRRFVDASILVGSKLFFAIVDAKQNKKGSNLSGSLYSKS
jgi:glycosyltransferase involved in cell wall biosynthesis